MLIRQLSHSMRGLLQNRLERLHAALSSLGRRLRASIAEIIANQLAEAVRQAVENSLRQQQLPRASSPNQVRAGPSGSFDDNLNDQDDWQTPTVPPAKPHLHEQAHNPKPSRRQALLTSSLQLAFCWLHGFHRPALPKLLFAGTLIATITLFAGPFVGALVMIAGLVASMTGLCDVLAGVKAN